MQNKQMNLALQGGGSHGAFTWGVLDRLLEDGRIGIEGISGASAGAMNATVLAHGYTVGGRDGARQALETFWESVAIKKPFSLVEEPAYSADRIADQVHPPLGFEAVLAWTRFFSPYQLNPFDINPLRDMLGSQIDFERLRTACPIKLFIAATHVNSGTLRIFRNRQMSLDVLLASACLPAIYRAVEINGEAYWDGGFTANPPLFPLLHQCNAADVMLVLLHSATQTDVPTTADQIYNRLTEIGFGAALSTELQGIALAKREAERGMFAMGRLERRLRKLNLHAVDSKEFMGRLNTLSKLNTQAPFLHALRDEGREQADRWLKAHFHLVGVSSSLNLAQFLH
ncbi:MAG: patatin-like phospholipase family protein [Proteobacteria bacterium]|nr:patatin-like phospholipase family protein [Pseudomonadota bacterium]